MNERVLIGIISLVTFCAIAFTPVVELLIGWAGTDNIYAVRAGVGVMSLVCSYGALYGFFSKEGERKTKKEGRIGVKTPFLIAGIICILVSWFTNLPQVLVGLTGVEMEGFNGEVYTRVGMSLMTGLGVILLRFSTFRRPIQVDEYDPIEGENKYRNYLMDVKE